MAKFKKSPPRPKVILASETMILIETTMIMICCVPTRITGSFALSLKVGTSLVRDFKPLIINLCSSNAKAGTELQCQSHLGLRLETN
jgi:hypothetical protein